MSDRKFPRRDVLRHLAGGTIAVTAASYLRILGANDRVQVGVIGCGLRGQSLIGAFQKV